MSCRVCLTLMVVSLLGPWLGPVAGAANSPREVALAESQVRVPASGSWRIARVTVDGLVDLQVGEPTALFVERGRVVVADPGGRTELGVEQAYVAQPGSLPVVSAGSPASVLIIRYGDAADDGELFRGPDGRLPAGAGTLRVELAVVAAGEPVEFDPRAGSTVVFAVNGTVAVDGARMTATSTGPESAVVVAGSFSLRASGEQPAHAVIVTLSPVAATPVAQAGTGTVRLEIRLCPSGTFAPPAEPTGCAVAPDAEPVQVIDEDGNAFGLDALSTANGTEYSKPGLSFGHYRVSAPLLPRGVSGYAMTGAAGDPVSGYSFELTPEHPVADLVLYLLPSS